MAVVLPALHAEQHRLHGADHVHTAWGIVPLDGSGVSEHAAAHADFDRVLGELDLADVFFAGATDVDCRYADFTLVDACAVAGSHALAFGDALLHQHRHAHGPSHDVDFGHGRGALAHFAASLLPTRKGRQCVTHEPVPALRSFYGL